MKRKITALCLALSLSLTLCACGGSGGEASSQKNAPASTPPEASSQPEPTVQEPSCTVAASQAYSDGMAWVVYRDESGATYVITDVDSSGNGEMTRLDGGETTTISDELSGDPVFLDEKQILYVSDGDLYLWDGKEERRVARDVEMFWTAVQEAYTVYTAYGWY